MNYATDPVAYKSYRVSVDVSAELEQNESHHSHLAVIPLFQRAHGPYQLHADMIAQLSRLLHAKCPLPEH